MSADPDPTKTDKQAERDARLAAALRENLRRRKCQARARGRTGETGGARELAPAVPREAKS